jgi:hypothetical protein
MSSFSVTAVQSRATLLLPAIVGGLKIGSSSVIGFMTGWCCFSFGCSLTTVKRKGERLNIIVYDYHQILAPLLRPQWSFGLDGSLT